ncbi:hypothetical protein PIGHUM_04504 [Pigmentiphaga humi]|uniref:Uncharacterized protein n=1 Tax=Pigmentiphaga humi TaxID=2478468 RepID=A0A3P4BBA4_9BURK|nr:hypothetical protein [Pigmentiphaga humi]VCU72405.1 hypothetical protein PIGHUM_04504 [Pigmentiphaga humi]
MNITHLEHAVVTLIVQALFGLAFGNWFIGGVMACCWWMGREHAQAEDRWVGRFGQGRRANMPWWGGFDPKAWHMDGLLDWVIPIVVAIVLYVVSLVIGA